MPVACKQSIGEAKGKASWNDEDILMKKKKRHSKKRGEMMRDNDWEKEVNKKITHWAWIIFVSMITALITALLLIKSVGL